MKTLARLLHILMFFCAGGCANTSRLPTHEPIEATAPVLVLWSVGSFPCIDRSPRAAVYSDGTILYAPFQTPERVPSFLRASLSRTQYEGIFSSNTLLELSALKPAYHVSFSSDAQDNIIQWQGTNGMPEQTSVNGTLDNPRLEGHRSQTPHGFLTLFDKLASFTSPNATPYTPASFQVNFTPIKNTDSPSIDWPAAWPQPVWLSAEANRGVDNEMRAEFPGRQFTELHAWIWAREKAGQLIRYKGGFYVAATRAIFPGNPQPLPIPELTHP